MRAIAVALNLPPSASTADIAAQVRVLADLLSRAAIVVLFSIMAVRFGENFL